MKNSRVICYIAYKCAKVKLHFLAMTARETRKQH